MLLGNHPDLIDGPETHLFLPLPIDTVRLENRFQMPPDSLKKLKDRVSSKGAFIEGFQNLLLARSERSRWVEKTSRNVHVFEWILERFPSAILLHIIRDPRDVVVSLRSHPKYKRGQRKRIPTNWLHPWEECIDRWKRSVGEGISFRGRTQYMEVKYEALITETESILRRICNFAGIPFDSSMLSVEKRRNKVVGNQRSFVINNIEAGKSITQNRIGRWREELPLDILEKLEYELKSLMIMTGYI